MQPTSKVSNKMPLQKEKPSNKNTKTKITCSKYQQQEHNRRTCTSTNDLQQATAKCLYCKGHHASAKKLVRCNASPSFAMPPSRYMHSCPSQRSFSLRLFSITSSHDFSLQHATPIINVVKFEILDLIWYPHFLRLLNFSSCNASSIAEFVFAFAYTYTHFIMTSPCPLAYIVQSLSARLYKTLYLPPFTNRRRCIPRTPTLGLQGPIFQTRPLYGIYCRFSSPTTCS